MTVRELEERVLKASLNMVQPDAMKDASGDVIISSEEGEMDGIHHKTLEVSLDSGTEPRFKTIQPVFVFKCREALLPSLNRKLLIESDDFIF